MEITANTTGMLAELSVATDENAHDYCVVVVKGTFNTSASGQLTLAEVQSPLVTADEHFGAPESSSVRYECDFALEKPMTDVLVVGMAVAPGGKPVEQLPVRLDVNGRVKDLIVHGERRWVATRNGIVASEAAAFVEMPISFDRAWGGQDDSLGPDRTVVEPRNLAGVGFHPHRAPNQIDGLPMPNVESVARPISSPRDSHAPVGLGCVGRSWQPRIALAGLYDQRWRKERAPFLPADFDPRFYQCAPEDQQFPHFRGGETLRCENMAAQAVVEFVIPSRNVVTRFRFHDGDAEERAVLDTVTLEPHLGRAMLVWRARVRLRKKLTALQEIRVTDGSARTREVIGHRNGKPMFAGLGATIDWLRARRGGRQ